MLLPTPIAADGQGGPREVPERRTSEGPDHGPQLRDLAVLLPTPTSRDGTSGPGHADTAEGTPDLRTVAALLPTPQAREGFRGMSGAEHAEQRIRSGRRNLDDQVALLPTPVSRDGDGRGEGGPQYWHRRRTEQGRTNGQPLGAFVTNHLLPTPRVSASRTSRHAATSADSRSAPSLEQAVEIADGLLPRELESWEEAPPSWQLLPTPVATDAKGTRNITSGRSPGDESHSGWTLSDVGHAERWGQFAPAIARWEQVLGRLAPDPTEPGSKGQPRLSPRFVEWMMGLPDGWVTGHVPRSPALQALGDGVMWQQVRHAILLIAAGIAARGG